MNLSPNEQKLFDYMLACGCNIDVAIKDIVAVLTDVTYERSREAQQYLGPYVTQINRKATDYEIIPGELKRTYRLITKVTQKTD